VTDDRGSAQPDTNERRCELAAVILAGGRSSRMGRAKASLVLGGVPLLARVAAQVHPRVAEIVIVAASDQELPAIDLPSDVLLRIVRDPHPYPGPLHAFAHGLSAITTPAAYAVGCDAPFLAPALLDLLARDLGEADALIPLWDDRPQPLAALYRRSLLGAIRDLIATGETRLQALARLPNVRLLDAERGRIADPDGASFATLNTPEDYTRAIQRLERSRR